MGMADDPTLREDFAIETFRYLEGRLQEIRRIVMADAANLAKESALRAQPAAREFRVEKEHVDRALVVLLKKSTKSRLDIGATCRMDQK